MAQVRRYGYRPLPSVAPDPTRVSLDLFKPYVYRGNQPHVPRKPKSDTLVWHIDPPPDEDTSGPSPAPPE